MRKKILVGVLLFTITTNILASNNNPIILVHGFLGWGRDEISDTKYWGGSNDIEAYLRSKGYTVYTVSVGPISSNYDCAIETFYQIKGGQLNYGISHSEKYGMVQKPDNKYYKGLYPTWDRNNPVHLIGYSFGGQTVRMLQHLLVEISEIENDLLLSKNQEGWVKSITTMSAPLNGATIADIVKKFIPFSESILPIVDIISTNYYDLDLYQWDLNRNVEESIFGYLNRLTSNPSWSTKNSIAFDATLNGAKKINDIISIDPSVYYFSYSTSCSKKDPNNGYHIPAESLSLPNYPLCYLMGRININAGNGLVTDSTWFENDGTVNTISMARPFTGKNGPEPMVNLKKGETPKLGVWNFMGKYNLDHKNFIGFFLDSQKMIDDMYSRFEYHASLLYSLP
ncbi:MAG: hypothetical protein CMG41_00620 [Candidatus Marinimicrobia bacterium]|nr:hypothetical protein [Candidatus Neomarinimicrobiota bacterium]